MNPIPGFWFNDTRISTIITNYSCSGGQLQSHDAHQVLCGHQLWQGQCQQGVVEGECNDVDESSTRAQVSSLQGLMIHWLLLSPWCLCNTGLRALSPSSSAAASSLSSMAILMKHAAENEEQSNIFGKKIVTINWLIIKFLQCVQNFHNIQLFQDPMKKKKARHMVRTKFEERYKSGKNRWFFQKLKF